MEKKLEKKERERERPINDINEPFSLANTYQERTWANARASAHWTDSNPNDRTPNPESEPRMNTPHTHPRSALRLKCIIFPNEIMFKTTTFVCIRSNADMFYGIAVLSM